MAMRWRWIVRMGYKGRRCLEKAAQPVFVEEQTEGLCALDILAVFLSVDAIE